MYTDNDKLLFDALREVLLDKQGIGPIFKEIDEQLQTIYPTFTQTQRDIVEAYAHTLADVFTAALKVAIDKKTER